MTISPAQAVWDAYEQILENECVVTDTDRKALAAAIRVAANQMSCYQSKKFLYSIADAIKLCVIATELENQ